MREGHVGPGLEHLERFRASGSAGHDTGSPAHPAGQFAATERSLREDGDALAARMLRLAWDHPKIAVASRAEDIARSTFPLAQLYFVARRLTMGRALRPLHSALTPEERVTLRAIVDLQLFGPTILRGTPKAWIAIVATTATLFGWMAVASVELTSRLVGVALALASIGLGRAGIRARHRLEVAEGRGAAPGR